MESSTTELTTSQELIFPSQHQNMTIHVYRVFSISDHLLVSFNETVIITNHDKKPFNTFLVYYPRDFWKEMNYVRVIGKFMSEDYRPIQWRIYVFTQDYIGLAVIFGRPIYEEENYTIMVLAEMPNIAWLDSPNNKDIYCYLESYKMPLIPYEIDKAKISIIAPKTGDIATTFDKIEPTEGKSKVGQEVYWLEYKIKPFNISTPTSRLTKFHYLYKLKTISPEGYVFLPLRFTLINREIRVSLNSELRVRDEFFVEAIAPVTNIETISAKWGTWKIEIGLAENVKDIQAYDDLGKLEVTEKQGEGKLENITFIEVKFRAPVIGNELYRFSITYTFSPSIENDSIVLSQIPLAPVINATIGFYTLRILSSYETNVNLKHIRTDLSFNKSQRVLGGGLVNYNEQSYAFAGLLPPDNSVIEITIQITVMPLLNIIGLLVMMLIPIVSFSLMITATLSEKKKETLEEIPRTKRILGTISQLIQSYEEYIAVENELDEKIYTEVLGRRPSGAVLADLRSKLQETYKRRKRIFSLLERVMVQFPELRSDAIELKRIEGRLTIIRRMILEEAEAFLRGEVKKDEYDTLITEYINNIKYEKTKRLRIINKLKDIFFSL